MSDEADESSTSENFVVASEVMSSAIRILSLLGLDDRQIADLFLAESGEGKALDLAIPAVDGDEEDAIDARPWRLGTLAENESFSKEIDRFAKRVCEVLKARFDELSTEVLAKRGAADEWRKIRDAMIILRGLVKQHLIPSLNRVASHLITGMTGGQRKSIVVDENFDVTVDGQALDTLSGSGKAVANLALRPGLGQVLTNKVFSVFIGDEIDASLDQDRSENCATTLQAVKGWLSQIILISHKTMPADYCIDLNTRS